MPIFMRYGGSGAEVGGAGGGVWKTTNFLTTDPAQGAIRLSRISLVDGVAGVDGHDPMPTLKAAELFEAAKGRAPGGRLYLATDTGVFVRPASVNNRGKLLVGVDNTKLSDPLTGRTRLVFGSDQGVFSRPGVGVLKSLDGGRTWQTRHAPIVEIMVVDACGTGRKVFRLKDVSITPGAGGTAMLSYTGLE